MSRKRKDFHNVKGLAYKDRTDIKINQRRPGAKNLDEIPFPETDELPMYKYNEPVSRNYPNARVVTSRGCSYGCMFCVEPLMTNRIYRKRSVGLVVEEIKMLIEKYNVKEIFFDDALFTIPRAKEIAKALSENGIKISWTCWMDWRISLDDLRIIKKSGCSAIKFGVESSDSKILESLGKPIYIDNIRRLVKDCKKAGILSHGSFMLGLPGETAESMKDTVDLAFSLGLNSCQFTVATPLPGTQFYKEVSEKGWLATHDWSKFESVASPVVEYPNCTREDIISAVEEVRRRKVKQFLKNPINALLYIWKLVRIKGVRDFTDDFLTKARFVFKTIFYKK
ncbi:MAG: radical SAM protein [Candidatus Omnitrophota bacterium]